MEGGFGAGAPPVVVSVYEEDNSSAAVDLPPGFRFHPTDEEIIMHYLAKKAADRWFVAMAIGEADLNKCEPWDLPKMAKIGEKEWFFFSRRDRKYPTGMRTNRATELGYWKATGKDKEIYTGRNTLIGMKKTLVFYKGRAPKGEKTNWVMHEYRLEGHLLSFARADNSEWVVSKVFHKNFDSKRNVEVERINTSVNHALNSPPTLPPSNDPILATTDCQNNESKGKFVSSSRTVLDHQQNSLTPTQKNPHTTISNPFSTPYNLDQQNPNFFPNSLFQPQAPSSTSAPGCHQQDGQYLTVSGCPTIPFNGSNQASVRPMAPKTNHFSSNSSLISRPQETGVSKENVANEITSVPSIERNYKPLDQELESLFGHDCADLDFLWSY